MFRELLMTMVVSALAFPGMSYASGNGIKAGSAKQPHGVRLSPSQAKVVQAVSGGSGRRHSIPVAGASKAVRIPTLPMSHKKPQRVNASGSRIQGWRISDEYGSIPSGWYELNLDGNETLLWEYHDPDWIDDGWGGEPSFPFTTGFYQDNKIVGFHSEMILYWLIWGYGSFTLDGEILEYHEMGDDLSVTDFSTYVISCVHDENTGETYAYTLNTDASGYMLQKVDTRTWKFTPVVHDVAIENVCIGIAYNPDNGKIYGYTPDSRFVTLDTATGNLTMISKFDFPVTTTMKGMTYSPLDKAFMFVYTGSGWGEYASLYTITPAGEITFHAALPEALQYNILVTPDKIVNEMTPLTPGITDIVFERGSNDGTAIIKMPETTFGGQHMQGTLTLTAYVDGILSETMAAQPGESVSMPIRNVAEGMRKFSFTVTSGDFESASVERKLYIGYDTPVTPENITLTEGSITWESVTKGVNGGYIDCDALTYNIYLNGEKINDTPLRDCSYTFTMPDEIFRKYVAQVEADNHGHLSQHGFSNDIKSGRPFPLPFSMQPTVSEGELIKIFSDNGPWHQWSISNDPSDSYIYCSTTTYDESTDEWFILPAISIGKSESLIEITFEVAVQAGFSDTIDENITVAYGDTRSPEDMRTVKTWTGIDNEEDWRTLTAWCLPGSEDSYFGFKTSSHEDGGTIMVRNIRISMSGRSVMTPAEVSGLTAHSSPDGALKATVEFSMPQESAAGMRLSEEVLTAKVMTNAGEVSVSGMPGSRQSVEVPTLQGWNEITVTAANDNPGLENSIRIFTGMDVPRPLDGIKITHSNDYRALHLEWDAPTEGYNGGYVDPATVEYAWYEYDEDEYEWRLVKNLGNSRILDITPKIEEGIRITEGAILTLNSLGNSGIILQFEAPAGNPYKLPMIENLNDPELWGPVYEPLMLECPDDTYVSEWGYIAQAYPYQVSQPTPYGEGAFCAFGTDGDKSRISLPAFSTMGIESASVEIPIWCGPDAAEIAVYAETSGIEPELIGTFNEPSEECWRKHRFHLPSKFIDKEWVSVKVDAIFRGNSSIAAIADYRIKTFRNNDLGVTEIYVPAYAEAGKEVKLSATIENMGLHTVEMPHMEMLIYKDGNLVLTLPMECNNNASGINELETAHFTALWTPDGNACGELSMTARIIENDMDESNNSLAGSCVISPGNNFVIDDLKATVNDQNIMLSWSEPSCEPGREGFENYSSFHFSDKAGDFKTVSLDGLPTTFFSAFRFPHDSDIKGWQVLGESEMTELMEEAEMTNDYVHAYSGNNVLAAFVPLSYIVGEDLVSDKWLISPEVKGGSTVSFMLTAALTGYLENVEIMYSDSDDNPENFQSIDRLVILSSNWTAYEYTLPEDARYFAIVYRSASSDGFFIMVDDIRYSPAEEPVMIEGYDIIRDGMVISRNVSAHGSWIDDHTLDNRQAVYNVMPVLQHNGVTSRGVKSNDAVASTSGIGETIADNCIVTAGKGYITVEGCMDTSIAIYNADGIIHAIIDMPSEKETVKADKGIYIVRTGEKAQRVIVK